jgi:eukaryotic-like serine/threonine-protein kinase
MAPEPEAGGGRTPDAADSWGIGWLVGDGRYRMTHRLGRGGMAEVFAAEDVRLGRTVAIKLLRSDLAEDPVSKARFTREAQSVAGLNHHAVVAVYDSGEDVVGGQTVPYIVMELVEGRTIRDLLVNADAPPAEQALIIVSGVLEALAYSHQHGIVHRDIKPANVIITETGAVKVMDFGIARALHGAQSTMTQTGMVMGTPQYLSPEQALGKAVDHRSDLYATGCLLYELLTQRPPFVGETPLAVVYQHVQDVPVPPSEVSADSPPELDGLVMRSLAKEPDDRFQSAEEMRGLVQYGLQMLQQQGGFTGTWSTGAVEPLGPAATTALGGMAATSQPGQGGGYAPHGDTAQRPMLPPTNPNDGGYGYGYDDTAGQRRGSRGKMWLFVALAIVAIVAGAAYAIQGMGGSGGAPTGKDDKSPVAPTKTSHVPPPPDDDTQGPDEPQRSGSDDTGQESGEAPSNPPSPTLTEKQSPSTKPSSPGHSGGSTDGGGTTDGGKSGGGTAGTTSGGGGQQPPPTQGSSGGSNGSAGTGTGGGGTDGGTDAGTVAGSGDGGADGQVNGGTNLTDLGGHRS